VDNYTDIAQYLIEQKCDVDKADRLKQAPIHAAVAKGRNLPVSSC